jgi:hypothetical protein
MICIRSPDDLKRSRLPVPLHEAVSKVLAAIIAAHGSRYVPENDGYIIVVTPTDTDASLSEQLSWKWRDSVFEGISFSRTSRCWELVYLRDNQCAMSVVVQDADWLDPAIRERIKREAEPGGGEQPKR